MRLPTDPAELANYCRSSALAVSVGNEVLCRILGTKPFYCPASDQSLTPHLSVSGFWDPDTTCFLAQAVQPGMRWANIGANLGYFAVLLSELTSDAPGVCWEPSIVPFTFLSKNLRVNGCLQAQAVQVAAGSFKQDNATLSVSPECLAGGSLYESPYAFPAEKRYELVRVEQFQEPVDVLLVDAEGCDLDIVLSLEHKPSIVVCEFAAKFPQMRSRLTELFDAWHVWMIRAGTAYQAQPHEVLEAGVSNLVLRAR